MNKENIKFISNFDSLELDALIYIPDNIKGIVQIAHGMCDHKSRYIPFLEYLTNHGYVACIHDHRGHGNSVKCKEDLGHFYDKTGQAIVEDVHQITLFLKDKFKDVPLILFGHSMGSLVVRAYTSKYDEDINKLIVCGSPSYNPATNAALALIDLDIVVKGEKHISKMFTSLATGDYNKPYSNEGNNAWLSVNKQNVINYNNDPKCGFPLTLNGYRNLIILMKETYKKDGWIMKNPSLPIFFISGSDDPCTINKEKWLEAIENMKSHGYKNVSGKMYEGYRHEILNEDIKEEVFNDILNFIEN